MLPMLIAGDLFLKLGNATLTQGYYVSLSADQRSIVWARWLDDEGPDHSTQKSLALDHVTCVSSSQVRASATVPAVG